ncbi:MAG TPA: amidohydrolase family protein [Candidatus Hydrogenedentes bacterium]|nr:amidohydrolase family protein [Candidatus Hydrogenedentota bacterium]HRT20930.1 amidohydrolase family protein [Candidatus Hydrogenedentota bacterium]HRT63453.1 amidohydrolase family protein [Candidatus Hydrogenedentota bacterium]
MRQNKAPALTLMRKTRTKRAWLLAGVVLLILLAIFWPRRVHRQPVSATTDLKRIQEQRLIIDVHEHIASLEEVPKMLAAMDAAGIGKTCLMGSSRFTLTLNPSVGFTGYDEVNEELMKICEKYPDRFEAWPTLNPLDPDKLEKFSKLVDRGAKGLKLYLGHGYIVKKTNQYMFHPVAMDDPGMLPVYQYCQDHFVPVCLHVNPSPKAPGFAQEFIAVLDAFPDMKVVCPHFMLSSILQTRLEEFLDTYPNLYSDISFGHDDFLSAGLRRISKSPDKFRALFNKYPTRFMYATDLVVTPEALKTVEWIHDRFRVYLDMLTQTAYTTSVLPREEFRGLALKTDLLERILYKNFQDFTALKPKGTKITRKIDWNRMGVTPINRKPGEAIPPPPL